MLSIYTSSATLRHCHAARSCEVRTLRLFELPEEMVSDGGPQFRSKEFKNFLKERGVVHIVTPPHHPASNGTAEKTAQTVERPLLEQVLEDDLRGKRGSIQEKLSCFLFAHKYRKAPCRAVPKRLLRTRLLQLKPGAMSLPQREKRNKKRSWRTSVEVQGNSFEWATEFGLERVRNERVNLTKEVLKKVIGPVTNLVRVANQIRLVHADHLRFQSEDSS